MFSHSVLGSPSSLSPGSLFNERWNNPYGSLDCVLYANNTHPRATIIATGHDSMDVRMNAVAAAHEPRLSLIHQLPR